jgi:hypothetical protein
MRFLVFHMLYFFRLILSFFLLLNCSFCLFGRSEPKHVLNSLKKVFFWFRSEVKFWNVEILSCFFIFTLIECCELFCGSFSSERKTRVFFLGLVLAWRTVGKGRVALNLKLGADFLAFSRCAVNANDMHVCVLFFGKAQPFFCHCLTMRTPRRKEF